MATEMIAMCTHPMPHVAVPEGHRHLDWRHLFAHFSHESPGDDDLLARYKVEVALLVEQIGRLQHLGLVIELARQRLQEGADPASIDRLLVFALDSLGPDDLVPVVLDVLDSAETPELDALNEMWREPGSQP
jgi:hypothetical protein